MASVYLETSIIGYLASRPFKEPISAANQQLTIDWWNTRRDRFELFVSEAVLEESRKGDPIAAEERAVLMEGLPILASNPETRSVSRRLMAEVPLPAKARVDALHIAIAASYNIEYLLTWNCRHIANAAFRSKIEAVLMSANFSTPILCTPQELFYV
jgi:predicted nucleic acid-binding protein